MKNEIVCAVTLLAVLAAKPASGQITLTGTNYTQVFDTLAAGLPPGWSVRTNATAASAGVDVAFTTNNTTWGSTSGQFANYASTANNGTNLLGTENSAAQAACANRCLGVRQSGTFGDPGAAFVFRLANTLGFAQFQLQINLNLLSVQGRSNVWTIDYAIGASPDNFIPVWTHTDPGQFGATTTTISFGAVLDNQAQPVWIRVVALGATAGSGSRDTFGVDEFRLNYSAYGTATAVPLNIERVGTNVVLSWSDPSFDLQSASYASGTYVSIPGAVSPFTNPVSEGQRYFRLKAN